MLNMIKSDLYKLKRNRAFWINLILAVLVSGVFIIGMYTAMGSEITMMGFDMVTNLPIYLGIGFHHIFIAIFVTAFVSAEFSYGTIKNMISRGTNRNHIVLSKIIVASLGAMVILVSFIGNILLLSAVIWGFGSISSVSAIEFIGFMGLQILLAVGYTSVFVFVAMSIKNIGGALSVNLIALMMGGVLISAVELLLGGNIDIGRFWLDQAGQNLNTFELGTGYVLAGVIAVVTWIKISTLMGVGLFSGEDL